jgi:hypothetical protein
LWTRAILSANYREKLLFFNFLIFPEIFILFFITARSVTLNKEIPAKPATALRMDSKTVNSLPSFSFAYGAVIIREVIYDKVNDLF